MLGNVIGSCEEKNTSLPIKQIVSKLIFFSFQPLCFTFPYRYSETF